MPPRRPAARAGREHQPQGEPGAEAQPGVGGQALHQPEAGQDAEPPATTGRAGTRKGRGRAGSVRRRNSTAAQMTTKARSVPMLTRSPKMSIGSRPAVSAVTAPVGFSRSSRKQVSNQPDSRIIHREAVHPDSFIWMDCRSPCDRGPVRDYERSKIFIVLFVSLVALGLSRPSTAFARDITGSGDSEFEKNKLIISGPMKDRIFQNTFYDENPDCREQEITVAVSKGKVSYTLRDAAGTRGQWSPERSEITIGEERCAIMVRISRKAPTPKCSTDKCG